MGLKILLWPFLEKLAAFILMLKFDFNISYHIFVAHVPGTLHLLNLILSPTMQNKSCSFYRLGN